MSKLEDRIKAIPNCKQITQGELARILNEDIEDVDHAIGRILHKEYVHETLDQPLMDAMCKRRTI